MVRDAGRKLPVPVFADRMHRLEERVERAQSLIHAGSKTARVHAKKQQRQEASEQQMLSCITDSLRGCLVSLEDLDPFSSSPFAAGALQDRANRAIMDQASTKWGKHSERTPGPVGLFPMIHHLPQVHSAASPASTSASPMNSTRSMDPDNSSMESATTGLQWDLLLMCEQERLREQEDQEARINMLERQLADIMCWPPEAKKLTTTDPQRQLQHQQACLCGRCAMGRGLPDVVLDHCAHGHTGLNLVQILQAEIDELLREQKVLRSQTEWLIKDGQADYLSKEAELLELNERVIVLQRMMDIEREANKATVVGLKHEASRKLLVLQSLQSRNRFLEDELTCAEASAECENSHMQAALLMQKATISRLESALGNRENAVQTQELEARIRILEGALTPSCPVTAQELSVQLQTGNKRVTSGVAGNLQNREERFMYREESEGFQNRPVSSSGGGSSSSSAPAMLQSSGHSTSDHRELQRHWEEEAAVESRRVQAEFQRLREELQQERVQRLAHESQLREELQREQLERESQLREELQQERLEREGQLQEEIQQERAVRESHLREELSSGAHALEVRLERTEEKLQAERTCCEQEQLIARSSAEQLRKSDESLAVERMSCAETRAWEESQRQSLQEQLAQSQCEPPKPPRKLKKPAKRGQRGAELAEPAERAEGAVASSCAASKSSPARGERVHKPQKAPKAERACLQGGRVGNAASEAAEVRSRSPCDEASEAVAEEAATSAISYEAAEDQSAAELQASPPSPVYSEDSPPPLLYSPFELPSPETEGLPWAGVL
mmetsp:Transcript_63660/g.148431  ORF Transcript_63660/g.148431 Transcript_63660/m.148431 type:complete len:792 (-) Transcript_63660:41-2416(-)